MSRPAKPLLALALVAGLALPAAAEEIGPGTVVARVGATEITLGHMIVMRAQLPPEYQALPDDTLYQAILDQLIRQTAVAEQTGGALSLGARLALENERRSFLAGEALGRAAEEAATEEAIQAAYEAAFAGAEPTPEYRAAHILVETEEEAQAAMAQVQDGADFAELAKETSIDSSGQMGGELGWFTKGMMVQSFEDVVVAMEPGTVAGPFETQFGWHLVKLHESRLKDAPALDEVRESIVQQIQRDAMEAALERYAAEAEITRAEIEIDPAVLKNRELLDN
ncbi:peptidyl-prolyl cis-trans isomerase [Rhodovulum tesquicola]|uniref:peptidylprolyl isomerase n=1 Tax=Rhodovulum tesquicola TaxID=540254 RepID=UPI0020977E2B|nr:peptidylprolyl isomerase [Rhodovulum tesquicola]MCO8143700.1 peptidyl-prolyl cis-trans isomerase [Rhodovulum tesquicola]